MYALSAGRVGETKRFQFSEEGGDVVEAFLSGAPENRMPRAYGISKGSCGLSPINGLWRVNQYWENIPMFT